MENGPYIIYKYVFYDDLPIKNIVSFRVVYDDLPIKNVVSFRSQSLK